MASYQTRQRDPLLDSTTQAAIEKRGRELVGIGLFIAGLLVGMMLWSYAADDPNFMSATDADGVGSAVYPPLRARTRIGSCDIRANCYCSHGHLRGNPIPRSGLGRKFWAGWPFWRYGVVDPADDPAVWRDVFG